MSLIYCTKHKGEHTDAGICCFVNPDGKHTNPRDCLCRGYKPSGVERKVSHFTPAELHGRRVPNP